MMHVSICIQSEDFAAQRVLDELRKQFLDVGAMVAFVGIVREQTEHESAQELFLEHYPGMTEASIARIIDQAEQRWPLSAVHVTHRVGWLRPQEQIVLVIAASAHRHAAFDACRFVMDYLKTEAVFWKKERLRDGSLRWIESSTLDHSATAAWRHSSSS